jgi:uncharacterized protein
MATMLQRTLIAAGLAGVLTLAAPAYAGPPEDYATARRAYQAGDVAGAMPLLRKAAEAGHAPAQVLLGEILDLSEYDEEAAAMYRKAADQSNAEGQFRLGTLYSQGEGVKKDANEARRLIKLAAEQGHAQAANVMAHAYLNAQLGVAEGERDSAESLRWVKAAEQNDYLPAIDALILAYRNGGLGLAPDAKEADRLQAKANALRNIQQAAKVKGRRK